MNIVCDTSPITNLLTIGEIEILREVFQDIIIPIGVYLELEKKKGQKELIDKLDWIRVEKVNNETMVIELLKTLDRGESESVILAKELNADFLLIDEKKGRKLAQDFGIAITGLLGVLVIAKSKGFIKSVKPIIDKLIIQAGFRIHPALYQEVLKRMNE